MMYVTPAMCEKQDSVVNLWVLLIGGCIEQISYTPPNLEAGYQFLRDTYYMYWVANSCLSIPTDHIYCIYPEDFWTIQDENHRICIPDFSPNATPTLQNVNYAITGWLKDNSDADDIVLLYFASHGVGFNGEFDDTGEPKLGCLAAIDGSRGDTRDEGDEYMCPNGTWFGVDEAICLIPGGGGDSYDLYDDELGPMLDTISCGTLILVLESCYNGGFIDDLSGPKRLIITDADETSGAYINLDDYDDVRDGFSEFYEGFMDALSGSDTKWNVSDSVRRIAIVDSINASERDPDGNGHVSIYEAFQYAFQHDDARIAVRTKNHTEEDRWSWMEDDPDFGKIPDESPWFDDDSDGLPTFCNSTDNFDSSQGDLAKRTYMDWLLGDINEDGQVEPQDFYGIGYAFGSCWNQTRWNPKCDLNSDGYVELMDFYYMSENYGKNWSSSSGYGSSSSEYGTFLLDSGTTLSIVQDQITVIKDDVFSVNITLSDVTDLYGWEYKLFWDNAILNCTSSVVYAPDIWSNNTFWAGPGVENDYNSTHGRFCKLLIAIYPTPSFNGTTVTATLTFKAIASGTTVLDFRDTKLIDSQGAMIVHTAQDGSVTALLMRITKRPNAAGIYTQFPYQYPTSGSHWDKVDEETSDEGSTVIFASDSTSWYKDSFNFENITIPENATIKSVTVYNCVSSLGSGVRAGYQRTLVRTYNTDYFGATNRPPTSYTTYSTTYTVNPYTGQAWTAEEVNALQIGIYARATYHNGEYWDVDCTQVYILVEVI